MSKRRTSIFAVQTTDWMNYRPYKVFVPSYDGFYLRLSNEVFNVLNAPHNPMNSRFSRPEIIELSVILTSWFEDFANEIGLWATFLRQNKALHGYWLPFFPLEHYDPEDMNQEDVHYLIWHYCCKASDRFYTVDSPPFQSMAAEVLELFDEIFDDAPGTDYYEAYLKINHDANFFDVKYKLGWIAFGNYLIAPEFKKQLDKQVKDLDHQKSVLDPQKMTYTLQNDFLFRTRSSFLAFSVPEWLTAVGQYPDTLSNDIRNLSKYIISEFIYEKSEGIVYHFRQMETNRLFEVHQESVTMKGINWGDIVFTTIVEWQGTWWVTGTIVGFGQAKPDDKNYPARTPFYARPEEDQQMIRETTDTMERLHVDYYGSYIIFLKNQADTQTVIQGFNDYYNEFITNSNASQKAPADLIFHSPSEAGKQRVAICFDPGRGPMISPVVAEVAYLLEQDTLTDDQEAMLFFDLFSMNSIAIIQQLLARFTARNLRWPVAMESPIESHLDFLCRFYNPNSFGNPIPNTTLSR
jgi:Protein of unknown function (DUF3843)